MSRDYYEVLGLTRSATSADIKKAYLQMAKQYHPDKNQGDKEAEKKFKEISAAYDVLKDEQKKSIYDQVGHDGYTSHGGQSRGGHAQGGFGFSNTEDIFGDFFKDFMGGTKRNNRSPKIKGADLKYNLSITLEEAFKGVEKDISFSSAGQCSSCKGNGSSDSSAPVSCSSCNGQGVVRMQQGFFTFEQTCSSCSGSGYMIKNPCKTCNGDGRVEKNKKLKVVIPAGIEEGSRIRIAGEGEAGSKGGSNGDLYVFVTIAAHKIFKVDGKNLHLKLVINFTQAALGAEVEVPTIEGGKVSLKIPAGTETGDKIKLREKGMTIMRSTNRSDMYAHIFISTPKKLTQKQRELIEKLSDEFKDEDADQNKNDDGFFSKMKNIWS